MNFYTPPPLPLTLQHAALRAGNHNGNGNGGVKNGTLTWVYSAQPTPVSRVYRLRLTYALYTRPNLFVVDPDLNDLAGGRTIPHLYDQQRVELCLYLPRTSEWHSRRLLADTLVPWSLVWLFYFEEWLTSGEWKGSGEHPPAGKAVAPRSSGGPKG